MAGEMSLPPAAPDNVANTSPPDSSVNNNSGIEFTKDLTNEVVNIMNENMERFIDRDMKTSKGRATAMEFHADVKCNSSRHYRQMERRRKKVVMVMCIALVILVSVYYLT